MRQIRRREPEDFERIRQLVRGFVPMTFESRAAAMWSWRAGSRLLDSSSCVANVNTDSEMECLGS
jgi:hypothetical protein